MESELLSPRNHLACFTLQGFEISELGKMTFGLGLKQHRIQMIVCCKDDAGN